ncbi:regulatory protein GemA [Undibacterium sp.]|jgi:phage gp16-like protein|uniref:gp16 family protein n=1 Tax=Undibacterium sp. TaxID=1914977 RepID=UPI002BACBE59|nr:regulatory protein GemA [Undibacterium sp.]HTD05872.1 regulatory protein GemA [Undibacterium sp.]
MQPMRTAEQARKAELAQIHIAKMQLAMEDDAYRALLTQVTGKASSKDLTWQERKALLDHFKKIGFKPRAKPAGRAKPAVAMDRQSQIKKIEAQLAAAGRAWAYADSMAQRICKVERIEWCDHSALASVIAALAYDAKRRAKRTANAQ